MELHTCTKFSQEPIKFFMFHKSASFFLLMILLMQNLTSIILFVIFNIIIKLMSDRGLPFSMLLRKISVTLTGKTKYKFYPKKRKDHIFSD